MSTPVFNCMVCDQETNGFPIHCSFCDKEMDKPGALLISPPGPGSNRGAMQVVKMHICCNCYEKITVSEE